MQLPAILKEFAEAAGEEAALKMTKAKGGVDICLPSLDHFLIRERPDGTHWLSEIVGCEAALKIISACVSTAGVRITMPTGRNFIVKTEIRQRIARGESVREIVEAIRCSPRAVYRMRRVIAVERRRELGAQPTTPKRT